MATVAEIMDALADQIQGVLCGTADPLIESLQVDGRLIASPTAPAIDIYPGDPFMERFTHGDGFTYFLSVRARVSTADHEGGQDLLLSLMDPDAAESLTGAIQSDATLGGIVDDLAVVEGPSAYGIFSDPGDITNRLLGAIWRVQVLP